MEGHRDVFFSLHLSVCWTALPMPLLARSPFRWLICLNICRRLAARKVSISRGSSRVWTKRSPSGSILPTGRSGAKITSNRSARVTKVSPSLNPFSHAIKPQSPNNATSLTPSRAHSVFPSFYRSRDIYTRQGVQHVWPFAHRHVAQALVLQRPSASSSPHDQGRTCLRF